MEKFARLQPAGKKEKIIKNAFKWDIRFNNILAHIFLQNSKFSFYWDRKVLPFMYVVRNICRKINICTYIIDRRINFL